MDVVLYGLLVLAGWYGLTAFWPLEDWLYDWLHRRQDRVAGDSARANVKVER